MLYVRDARMTTDVKNNESALGAGLVAAGGVLGGALGGVVVSALLPTRGFGVGADVVLVSTSTGQPVVVLGIAGAEAGDGALGTRLNQDVWRRAMHQFALSLAARTGARAH